MVDHTRGESRCLLKALVNTAGLKMNQKEKGKDRGSGAQLKFKRDKINGLLRGRGEGGSGSVAVSV